MRLPVEWKDMMLAGGVKGNVLLDHHPAAFHVKSLCQVGGCILIHPAVQFFAHPRDPLRRFPEPFPRYILADPFQEQPYRLFYFLMICHLIPSFHLLL